MRRCPSCEEKAKPITISVSPDVVKVRCPLCRGVDEIPQDTGVPVEHERE